MSQKHTLLDSIKAKMMADNSPVDGAAALVATHAVQERKPRADAKPKSAAAADASDFPALDEVLSEGGFRLLIRVLEDARGELDFDRRIVYIDEESAEVLDLLRKKAKIKSNLLVSYLLHEFFQKHKTLLQELMEKRNNKLLD